MFKCSCLFVLLIAAFSNSGYSQTNSDAASKTDSQANSQALQTIRFYRANNQQQGIRLNIAKEKTNSAGCHNFKRAKRVATIVQLGFGYCSLYSEKSCLGESLIQATHSEQDIFSSQLTPGYGWQTKKETKKDRKGVKARSWYCE